MEQQNLPIRQERCLQVAHWSEGKFSQSGKAWFSIRVFHAIGGHLMEGHSVALFCCLDDCAWMFQQ